MSWTVKTSPGSSRQRGLWERERFTNNILSLSDQSSASVHRYNQATDSWDTSLTSAPATLGFGNESGWVAGRSVFVVAGASGSTATTISVYTYRPSSDSWTAKTSSPTTTNGIDDLAGAVVSETGTVHFVGATEHRIYTLATDSWSTGTARPVSELEGCAASMDGLLYVTGGTSTAFHSYDPLTDTWAALAATGTTFTNGSMCAFGGYIWAVTNDGSTFKMYDPVADTWTAKANPSAVTTLSGDPRITGKDGKVYLLQGTDLLEYAPDVAMEEDDPPASATAAPPAGAVTATPVHTVVSR